MIKNTWPVPSVFKYISAPVLTVELLSTTFVSKELLRVLTSAFSYAVPSLFTERKKPKGTESGILFTVFPSPII